jgi:C-5 cytosine-specific DNA methylase
VRLQHTASEIDENLAALYEKNFGIKPHGDIRGLKIKKLPAHDILARVSPASLSPRPEAREDSNARNGAIYLIT